MFEPLNLVPNINEIMEKYTEREDEAIQVTQAAIEEEERSEARAEPKQPVEETRNGKRGAEKAGAEHNEEKGSNWVLELAYVA